MHRIGREELASGRKYRIYMECRNSKSTNQRNCVQSIHPHLYRMWIYVSSECTGRTYKSRADPGSSGRNLITSVSLQRSFASGRNAGLSNPYLSNAPNCKYETGAKGKCIVLCPKRSCIVWSVFCWSECAIKWSHSGFKKHVSAIYQSKCTCCIPPGKKEGAFLPALPEIAGEKLSRKNPLFSWKRGL